MLSLHCDDSTGLGEEAQDKVPATEEPETDEPRLSPWLGLARGPGLGPGLGLGDASKRKKSNFPKATDAEVQRMKEEQMQQERREAELR